ncbi:rhodanese-like domain-containing protein [Desulfocastanea catecholica]
MTRNIVILAAFISGLLSVAAAGAAEPQWMQTKSRELVDRARAETKHISIQELKQAIDDEADVVILDVRTPKEYEVAHIPESINAPRGLLEFSIWSLVPDQQETIYVYCKTGARAALATKLLNDLGYTKAIAVDTGGAEWVKAGYPVQTSISDETLILQPGPQ